MRPVDIVRKLCPKARASYIAAFENGDALFKQHGVTTPQRLAHFLAQVLHESGGLSVEWESGAYSASRLMEIFGVGHHSAAITPDEAARLARNGPAIFERVYGLGNPRKARELGNIREGDGYRYRGGGLMQTTGRANYRRMGQKCGVDFENHPELVLSAEHALKPALAEWTEGKLNAAADRDDIRAITKRINGGYNGLADRQTWLARIKPLLRSVDLIAPAERPAPAPEPFPPPPDVPAPRPKPKAKPEKAPWYKKIGTWILGLGGGSLTIGGVTLDASLVYSFCALVAVIMLAVAFWVYVIPPRGSFKVKLGQ